MSKPQWHAAWVRKTGITAWQMGDDGSVGDKDTLPPNGLSSLPGPVIAAGVPVQPRKVPAKAELATTHVEDLPHIAAITPLMQNVPAARTAGEEAAITGYLQKNSAFDGVLLVLSEQTCWAHISAGEVVSFQTFLTPELRSALGAPRPTIDASFNSALSDTLARPDRLAQHLASARAARTGQEATHLIGAEIAAAKPYWLGQNLVVLASEADATPYIAALQAQGVKARHDDLETALLTGLRAAWQKIAT